MDSLGPDPVALDNPALGTDAPAQEQVTRALSNALRAQRLAHGLLFTGAPGTGRERTARALAAGLLCVEGPLHIPYGCGSCRSCKRALSGSHPDVHIVMPEAEAVRRGIANADAKKRPSPDILVDAVRELAGRLKMAAYEGGARVAIVVDAHRMNVSGQNALLKTLEEPGAQTFLILIAPHERSLLPTIASRCLRLRFAPRPAAPPGDSESTKVLLHALLEGSASERLDIAEALGKDRAEVDHALAELQQHLAYAAREGVAGRGGIGWPKATKLLERVNAARVAIAHNGAVQLCLEELCLEPAPSRS